MYQGYYKLIFIRNKLNDLSHIMVQIKEEEKKKGNEKKSDLFFKKKFKVSILNASRVNNILASRHLYNMKTLFV